VWISYGYAALWVLLALVWAVAAMGAKRTSRSEPMGARVAYISIFFVGNFLLFRPPLSGPLSMLFVPSTRAIAIFGLILTAVGVAVAIWARLALGANWSGTVTIKQDHELIRRGPYRLVRHPIYSGILLAMLGTAIGNGRVACLLGVAINFASFRYKWKIEERFLIDQFGEQYIQYQREVGAVIPGL